MRYFSSALILFFGFASGVAHALTFTVTSTNDSGLGTLRNAITLANTTPGADTIAFNVSGAGVHTIKPLTALPAITQSVVIDGYTQTGATANTLPNGDNATLLIELDGSTPALGNVSGLTINAANCTVRGLVINRFLHNGIDINSDGNVITGNFIGTNTAGTAAAPNGTNGNGGVLINSGSNNTIGGTTPALRNLISGNVGVGVGIFSASSTGNLVQGNFLGVDASGAAALGNSDRGAFVKGSNNDVGGGSVGARNIISGNGRGVQLEGTGHSLQGNYIGTNAAGIAALANQNEGVNINGGNNILVGGATGTPGTPPGNVISGNVSVGLNLFAGASNNQIQGNVIGADAGGTNPLGNSLHGIAITSGSSNSIGGTSANQANMIAFNGTTSESGVFIANASNINNSIQGNSIFGNKGRGIDLQAPGETLGAPTLNDTGDPDTGANNLQNFPVLTSVTNGGGMTTINGRLNSATNTAYRLDFFANDAIDPSGYGEGQVFLGFDNFTTDGSGNATFTAMFPQIAAGQRVTATATDPNGNTSEFSGAIGQLLNISTRLNVQTGAKVLIGGFIINGSQSKSILVRALGPTLAQPPFNLSGVLGDPTLALFQGGTQLASNDNWADTQQSEINATGKAPPNAAESAILQTLAPNAYTAILSGKNATSGVGLVEVYDLAPNSNSTLANISTRGFVETGSNVMIGGFIVANGIQKVIVRGLGPTLAQPPFNVPETLADPVLAIFDANGQQIASNDNWKDTQQAEIQATGKAPPNNSESAIVITRPAGNTTAIVSGKNNTTGNALVEVYTLAP